MLGDILSLISMVISVVLICFLAYFVTKKLGTNNLFNINKNGGEMRVYDRLILAPNKSLVIVKVGQRLFLLGVSNENISLITELDAKQAENWSEKEQISPNFTDVISNIINKKGGKWFKCQKVL